AGRSSAGKWTTCPAPPRRPNRSGAGGGAHPARSRRGLAGLCRPLRDRTPLPLLSANAQVDHAQAAPTRGGRPLDVAAAAHLRPAALGTRPSGRRALTLAAAAAPRAADPRRSAMGLFVAPGTPGQSRQRIKTLRTLAGTAERQTLAACSTLSGDQTHLL